MPPDIPLGEVAKVGACLTRHERGTLSPAFQEIDKENESDSSADASRDSGFW